MDFFVGKYSLKVYNKDTKTTFKDVVLVPFLLTASRQLSNQWVIVENAKFLVKKSWKRLPSSQVFWQLLTKHNLRFDNFLKMTDAGKFTVVESDFQ